MHFPLLTDAGPRLAIAYGCGTRIYPRTGAILLAYVPTSFVEQVSKTNSPCGYTGSAHRLPKILCHQPDSRFLRHLQRPHNLSDFCCVTVELPAISWVEMFYIHLPTPIRNYTDLWMCQPNLRSGPDDGTRTRKGTCLEGRRLSHQTTSGYLFLFLRFLHIYYTRNFKKSQIFGAKSRARTYDLSGMNRLLSPTEPSWHIIGGRNGTRTHMPCGRGF